MNPKIIVYDFDRGLKSIGSDEQIEQHFGYKPRRFIKTKSAFEFFASIHKPGVIKTTDALGDVEEEYWRTKPGIDIEVLDSITAFSANKKKELKGTSSKVTLPQYGELGEAVEDLVLLLTRTDKHAIIISHVAPEKDDDLGIIRYVPGLTGKMKEQVGRYFDIIAYTHVKSDPKNPGKKEYLWQVLADERRDAKSRIDKISEYAAQNNGCIPQDFELLFNLAEGYPALKILILGNSGTGKTYSLKSLSKIQIPITKAA
jgi:hypothetical protein